jgi:ribosomal-protein-alanine N-acetyltransferase
MSFPTLRTERLVLRGFTMDDARRVQQLAGAREVAATTLTMPHPYVDGMAEAWIGGHAAAWEARRRLTLAVTSQADGVVGVVGLSLVPEHRRGEVGYWIGVPYWNRGFATEAAAAVLDFGFGELGLNRVVGRYFTRNPASGNVLRKLGMTREGTLREHVVRWGQAEDLECYAILAREWRERAAEPVLGLRRGAVRLVPHTPRWAELYREEEARLRAALDGVLVDVQHFGSTAVPGIHAKPILDVLLAVRRMDDVFERLPQLEALGYEYVPGAGVPGHHVFGKAQPRTHLLHVVEHGGPSWRENLWFRDRLRAEPALAAEYDTLKAQLARAHPGDRARYTAEKSAFIQRIRQQAP